MDNKLLKVLLHASAFFAPVLVPIIVYFVSDEREIKNLSLQALLFQGVMWLAVFVSTILMFVLIGFILLPIVGLIGIIVPIIGIVKALQDEHWEYPIVKRFF
ncbi:MAG: DUF4870 domain-containing protein [Lysinibacillus sp.]